MSKCIVKAILAKKNPKMCYTYNVERCLDIKCVFNCIAKATYLKKIKTSSNLEWREYRDFGA